MILEIDVQVQRDFEIFKSKLSSEELINWCDLVLSKDVECIKLAIDFFNMIVDYQYDNDMITLLRNLNIRQTVYYERADIIH